MKKKVEELLLVDELDLQAILIIAIGTILAFPIGYFIVFAEFGWWMK